jgi:hypothetical protein
MLRISFLFWKGILKSSLVRTVRNVLEAPRRELSRAQISINRHVVEPLLIEDVFVCCTRFLRMYIQYRLDIGHHHSPTKMLRGSRKACSRQARQWQRVKRCPAGVRHRDSDREALVAEGREKRSKDEWRICTVRAPPDLSGLERGGNAVAVPKCNCSSATCTHRT